MLLSRRRRASARNHPVGGYFTVVLHALRFAQRILRGDRHVVGRGNIPDGRGSIDLRTSAMSGQPTPIHRQDEFHEKAVALAPYLQARPLLPGQGQALADVVQGHAVAFGCLA